MISFDCEHCGKTISFDDDWTGRMGRCPSCQQLLEIPGRPDDSLVTEPDRVENHDTTEFVLTPDSRNSADETDILPAQGGEPTDQPDPETARDDADSWLRTYKQSKTIEHRRSNIRWVIIIASVVIVIVLLLIISL